MKTYMVVYFGSALVAMFLTPIVCRFAKKRGWVDSPGVRKVHRVPVPRIGGTAIMLGTYALTLSVFLLDNVIGEAFRLIQREVIVLIAGGLLVNVMGTIDDIRDLRPRTKLLVQLVAASAVCAAGVRIEEVGLGSWATISFGWFSWPVTVLWILGLTNAVNLIDGLDGLAAGISTAACGVMAVLAIWANDVVMAVLMLALLGSLTSFLFFNFNPAKVFMGDGGTYFVGFLIAGSTVMCSQKKAAVIALALPLLAMGVPVFDMLFSVLRRTLERRSIFAPDRGHIHHRLLALGMSQRHAVFTIYFVTCLMVGMGMWMLVARDASLLILFAASVVLILAFRAAGAIRLREALNALRRSLANARAIRKEQRAFENVQLKLREAGSFDDWWASLCSMGESMGFERITISARGEQGEWGILVWQGSKEALRLGDVWTFRIPASGSQKGEEPTLEISGSVGQSLEVSGRRLSLFGRLLDENGLPYLAGLSSLLRSEGAIGQADLTPRSATGSTGQAAHSLQGRQLVPDKLGLQIPHKA